MGGIALNVSLMNEKVTFQKNTVVTDVIGNHKNVWEDFYTCHATIGGEVEYQIDNRFSVAAGVGYIMQGKQWDDYKIGGVEWYDSKIELGYINVPIVANCYIFKGFAVKAGVQFAFMTNAKYKYTIKDGNYETKYNQDIKDNCKTFDFSIPVGVSYEFDNHIVIDARYNIGVTKVLDGATNHNSVLLATVGYKFRL